jgi:hypothetical protein
MIDLGSLVEIELDDSRFIDDEETRVVALVVARHAENRRREYRQTEKAMPPGLLRISVYWSDSVPWYEWMTEPQILQPCAEECRLPIYKVANLIAYQIRPPNWQVFSWMGAALDDRDHKDRLGWTNSRYTSILKAERDQKRSQAIEAGRASGKARRESQKLSPEEVATQYQSLMATGTEKRNVAAKLAKRYAVTPDQIRKLLKQANN